MRWLLAVLVFLAGCGPMVVKPVLILEPRPESLPMTIGVYYPDELRTFRKFTRHMVSAGRPVTTDFTILVGEASVRLFDEALGLLFQRVVSSPTVMHVGTLEGGAAGVVEPRIISAAMYLGLHANGEAFNRATITYAFTLYAYAGERLASWTVSGEGLATSALSLTDTASWNIEQRSVELAMREAAWKFMSGFRDVPEVRRWLDERGVR